jgi:hypothetical protein
MNKIGIIIKREYLRKVSKKSFLLLTLLMPFLFAALVFVPLWLSTFKGDDIHSIAILDDTGKYAEWFNDSGNYRFIKGDKSMEEYRSLENKEIFAFLSITDDLLVNPNAAVLYSKKQLPREFGDLVNRTLSKGLEDEKMASYNIPDLKQIIAESKIKFNIQTVKWGDDGSEKVSSSEFASIVGMSLTLIIYMFILVYGSQVMQGVMEEKTNRIIEVIISSVKPFDLMMGKIVGLCLVGLTQMLLWGVMTSAIIVGGQLFFLGGIDPSTISSVGMQPEMSGFATETGAKLFMNLGSINFVEIGIFFVLYFIGGYLLYASLFAAIGSAVESQEDTQQFMMPITMLIAFSVYAGMYSMNNPDGPLAFWCSLIPLTSPIVMMVRLPFDVPFWQQLVSIVLLYSTAFLITWFSAKIYRVGILMYGKKPGIKELIKWARYK